MDVRVKTIKKAEHRRIDAFELWCWRRLLRVPWTVGDPTSPSERRSVLGFHWKDWCWSWNSNTVATSCKELTHWKRPCCCGKDWRQEKGTTEDEMIGWHHRLDETWVWASSGSWWWTGKPGAACSPWGRKESDMTERLKWTEPGVIW